MARKPLYPGVDSVEETKNAVLRTCIEDEPDWVGGAPNYEKFDRLGWDTERVLVWLNID